MIVASIKVKNPPITIFLIIIICRSNNNTSHPLVLRFSPVRSHQRGEYSIAQEVSQKFWSRTTRRRGRCCLHCHRGASRLACLSLLLGRSAPQERTSCWSTPSRLMDHVSCSIDGWVYRRRPGAVYAGTSRLVGHVSLVVRRRHTEK